MATYSTVKTEQVFTLPEQLLMAYRSGKYLSSAFETKGDYYNAFNSIQQNCS